MLSQYCYLRSGHWSSVLPRSFVEWLAPPPGLTVARLISPSVTNTVGLIIPNRSPVPPLLLAFWEHVRREAPQAEIDARAIGI